MAMSGAILSGGEAEVDGSGWQASETLGKQLGLSPFGEVLH